MAARKKAARKATTVPTKRKKATAKKAGAKKATSKKSVRKKPAKAAARKAVSRKGASKSTAKTSTAKKASAKAVRKSTRKRAAPKAAAADAPAFPEIEALALLMDKHGLLEVKYSSDPDGATKIHVSKTGGGATLVSAPVAAAPAAASAPAPAPAATDGAAPAESEEGLHAFKSPMVGTFYRAPSPEASPFSSVGDSVDPANVVCIIEAMKVMNDIYPDAAGEIVSIEVENGEAVEFGQTLMLLRKR